MFSFPDNKSSSSQKLGQIISKFEFASARTGPTGLADRSDRLYLYGLVGPTIIKTRSSIYLSLTHSSLTLSPPNYPRGAVIVLLPPGGQGEHFTRPVIPISQRRNLRLAVATRVARGISALAHTKSPRECLDYREDSFIKQTYH